MDSPAQVWQPSALDTPFEPRDSDTESPAEYGSPLATLISSEEPTEDLPYAQLIFQALMSVPERQMVLQDIYTWFEQNTMKPQRCPNGKQGWRNSIRHNLSMNHAFQKIDPVTTGPKDNGKKSFIWRLSDEAQKTGKVMSTTRYRKTANKKRRSNEEVLHTRPGNGNRICKRSPGGILGRTESSTSPRQAIVNALIGEPNVGSRQTVADELHHPSFHLVSHCQHRDGIYVSFDSGFHYQNFDGTLTPASTMSTAADSTLPEPPITNTAYSPDVKFEPFESSDFEMSYDGGHAVSFFEDLAPYKTQQRDLDVGLDAGQPGFKASAQRADGLASAAGMGATAVSEPATCSMADLRLPTGEQLGFMGSYDSVSGYHGRFL